MRWIGYLGLPIMPISRRQYSHLLQSMLYYHYSCTLSSHDQTCHDWSNPLFNTSIPVKSSFSLLINHCTPEPCKSNGPGFYSQRGSLCGDVRRSTHRDGHLKGRYLSTIKVATLKAGAICLHIEMATLKVGRYLSTHRDGYLEGRYMSTHRDGHLEGR